MKRYTPAHAQAASATHSDDEAGTETTAVHAPQATVADTDRSVPQAKQGKLARHGPDDAHGYTHTALKLLEQLPDRAGAGTGGTHDVDSLVQLLLDVTDCIVHSRGGSGSGSQSQPAAAAGASAAAAAVDALATNRNWTVLVDRLLTAAAAAAAGGGQHANENVARRQSPVSELSLSGACSVLYACASLAPMIIDGANTHTAAAETNTASVDV